MTLSSFPPQLLRPAAHPGAEDPLPRGAGGLQVEGRLRPRQPLWRQDQPDRLLAGLREGVRPLQPGRHQLSVGSTVIKLVAWLLILRGFFFSVLRRTRTWSLRMGCRRPSRSFSWRPASSPSSRLLLSGSSRPIPPPTSSRTLFRCCRTLCWHRPKRWSSSEPSPPT